MVRKRIEAGAVIFAESAYPDFVVYIIEGEAEILKKQGDGRVLVGKAGPGDCVGANAAVEGTSHGETVMAASRMLVDILPSSEVVARAVLDKALSDKRQTRMDRQEPRLNNTPATTPATVFDTPPAVIPPTVEPVSAGPTVSLKSGSADLKWPLAHVPDPLPLPFTVGRRPGWQELAVDREVSLQLHDDKPFRI